MEKSTPPLPPYTSSDPLAGAAPLSNGVRIEMLPCVIPQIATSFQGPFMCPFVRAYAPELQRYGIDQALFLRFIDVFNEAFVASPVFQATNLAGNVMGQVHGLASVQIAGAALSVVSGLGSAAVSMVRAKAAMQEANRNIFNPVGLHAQVLTTKKLLLGISYPSEQFKLLPTEHDQETADAVTPSPAIPGHTALMRRQRLLDGYVQPLTFDVPPSESSDETWKRVGEWHAKRRAEKQQKKLDGNRKHDDKRDRKRQEDMDKENAKLEKELSKLDAELLKRRSSADRKMAKARTKPGEAEKIEADLEKEERKIERDRAKRIDEVEREARKHTEKGDKKRGKMERKEAKTANKIRWIVITQGVPAMAGSGLDSEDEESDRVSAMKEP